MGIVRCSCLHHGKASLCPSSTVTYLVAYCFCRFSALGLGNTTPPWLFRIVTLVKCFPKGFWLAPSFSAGLCWVTVWCPCYRFQGSPHERGPAPVSGQVSRGGKLATVCETGTTPCRPEDPRLPQSLLSALPDQRDSDKENKTFFPQSQIFVGNGTSKFQLRLLSKAWYRVGQKVNRVFLFHIF